MNKSPKSDGWKDDYDDNKEEEEPQKKALEDVKVYSKASCVNETSRCDERCHSGSHSSSSSGILNVVLAKLCTFQQLGDLIALPVYSGSRVLIDLWLGAPVAMLWPVY